MFVKNQNVCRFVYWQRNVLSTKKSIFHNLWSLTNNSIFDKHFDFWQNFRFLTNILTEILLVKNVFQNADSRNPMISWLCEIAKLNLKRAGMYSNDRELSPVNFILNVLHVLHNMCKKIDVSKVDRNYILNPKCRTKPGNDTTLLGTELTKCRWYPFWPASYHFIS